MLTIAGLHPVWVFLVLQIFVSKSSFNPISDTNALISESLKKEARTIFLKEGYNLSISCDLSLMLRIANESPTADFEWNKNGFRLGRRASDVKDLNENEFTLSEFHDFIKYMNFTFALT